MKEVNIKEEKFAQKLQATTDTKRKEETKFVCYQITRHRWNLKKYNNVIAFLAKNI